MDIDFSPVSWEPWHGLWELVGTATAVLGIQALWLTSVPSQDTVPVDQHGGRHVRVPGGGRARDVLWLLCQSGTLHTALN